MRETRFEAVSDGRICRAFVCRKETRGGQRAQDLKKGEIKAKDGGVKAKNTRKMGAGYDIMTIR